MTTSVKETYAEKSAREDAERAAVRTELKKTGPVVAAELSKLTGDTWAFTSDTSTDQWTETRAFLSHADGRKIYLTVGYFGHDGKVGVSGWYDYGNGPAQISWPYQVAHPGCKVSLSRGGAVIAREIQRRFLAEYTRMFAVMSERLRVSQRFYETRTGVLSRLASLGDAWARVSEVRSDIDTLRLYGDEVLPSVDIRAGSDYVELKMDVSEDTAVQILQLLKQRARHIEGGPRPVR